MSYKALPPHRPQVRFLLLKFDQKFAVFGKCLPSFGFD
jgi:hypothetical protein